MVQILAKMTDNYVPHTARAVAALAVLMALIGLGGAVETAATEPDQTAQSEITKPQALQGVSHPASLVELFTSQGCSSCPPTNASVRKASTHDGVLALSYSVDYWDYLGWKDTFGDAKFSKRQRQYGKHFNGSVYTPQIILNGRTHAPRYGMNALIDDVLHAQHDKALAVEKQLRPTICGIGLRSVQSQNTASKAVEFSIDTNSFDQDVRILGIVYRPGIESVDVKAGENRGHTIRLANIVKTIHEMGEAPKNQSFKTVLPSLSDGEAMAILVQAKHGSAVLDVLNYAPIFAP